MSTAHRSLFFPTALCKSVASTVCLISVCWSLIDPCSLPQRHRPVSPVFASSSSIPVLSHSTLAREQLRCQPLHQPLPPAVMARILLPWLLPEIAAAVYGGDRSHWKAYPQPSQYHDARKDAEKHSYSSASAATGSPEDLYDGRTNAKMRGSSSAASASTSRWSGEEAWRRCPSGWKWSPGEWDDGDSQFEPEEVASWYEHDDRTEKTYSKSGNDEEYPWHNGTALTCPASSCSYVIFPSLRFSRSLRSCSFCSSTFGIVAMFPASLSDLPALASKATTRTMPAPTPPARAPGRRLRPTPSSSSRRARGRARGRTRARSGSGRRGMVRTAT